MIYHEGWDSYVLTSRLAEKQQTELLKDVDPMLF